MVTGGRKLRLSLYWRLILAPQLPRLLLVVLSSFIGAVAQVASLGLIIPLIKLFSEPTLPSGVAIDLVARAVASFGSVPDKNSILVGIIIGMAALTLIRASLVLLTGYIVERISADIYRSFTERLFRSYLKAEYAETVGLRRGEILQNIASVAGSSSTFVLVAGGSLAAALELLVIGVFLTWLSWWMVLGFLLYGVAATLLLEPLVQRPTLRRTHHRMQVEQDVSATLVQGADAIKVLKTYGLVDRVTATLAHGLKVQAHYRVLFGLLGRLPATLFETMGMLLLLSFVAASLIFPQLRLDFAALAAFAATLLRALPTANRLNQLSVSAAQNFGAVAVLDGIINDLHPEPADGTGPLKESVGQVEFRKVSFSYPSAPGRPVLRTVDAVFRRGELSALTGETGSGKTTLVDLAVRLFTPAGGEIEVDGVDIRQLPLDGWRARIGYVSQDAFLFHASIRDNIALFDDSIPDETIKAAAIAAQVHDFVSGLPDGYATVVGDRGVTLSGGQRQRIAIARALARRPQILILDEATSALDNLTERAFQQAISQLRHECILIVVAHRLSTVKDADQILVMQDGMIVERGTFAELLSRQGQFWLLQNAHQIHEPQHIEAVGV